MVTLEPARAASNTAAMQRGTVMIKILAVGALGAGADALIDHLPDEVLAVVFCFVDAKTLFVAVPSVSLAGGHDVCGGGKSPRKVTSGYVEAWRESVRWLRGLGGRNEAGEPVFDLWSWLRADRFQTAPVVPFWVAVAGIPSRGLGSGTGVQAMARSVRRDDAGG